MKRALSAAIFGGLLVLAGPQAAFADHDHGSEATQPEGSSSPEPDRAPPAPYGDSEQNDDEDDTILF